MATNANTQRLSSLISGLEGISNEDKSELLQLLNERKKYGLVWENHPEDIEEELKTKLPILLEDKEKFIDSEDGSAPNHIIIEGDNLHVLNNLCYTHEGKIDVIYIDPPYNTGNKDFKYNDSFVDLEDEYRHSKWLSFMSKRLCIAKKLLAINGIIFISIDDNEMANLKLLCDYYFGANRHVGTFTWVRKKKGSNLSKEFRKITEYVLCYKNTSNNVELFGEKAYSEKLVPLLNRPNNYGELFFKANTTYVGSDVKTSTMPAGNYGDGELQVTLFNDIVINNGVIISDYRIKGRFRWSQDTVDNEIVNGSKFYISKSLRINVSRYNQGEKFKAASSLLGIDDMVGTNEDATQELRDIFAEKENIPFGFPKPTSLIRYLINAATANNLSATVLDFFAGSGTTMHAVMQLNAEDGGHRQCIIVTNNENNICEEVTYERNKRVIQGYTNSNGEQIEGLTANNLRYYKTGFVPRESSLSAKKELMSASTDMLCIKNDIYHEEDTFGGHKFRKDILRFFTEGEKKMLVVYHPDAIINVVDILREMVAEIPIFVYVFSANDYAMDADFEDVADKVTLCALPDAILRAYRRVLPKKKMED